MNNPHIDILINPMEHTFNTLIYLYMAKLGTNWWFALELYAPTIDI